MATADSPKFVVPNPRIPAALGTVNVILGIVLLLYGLAWIAWTLASPSLMTMLRREVQVEELKARAEREAQIAALKKRAKTERNADKKTEIQARIDALEEENNDPEFSDIWGESSMRDPRIAIPSWADTLFGLVANVLLIVSGAGLLALRHWGRRLALGVAGAKLVWVVAMLFLNLTFLIPVTVEKTRAQYARMDARMRASMPRGSFSAAMSGSAAAASAAFAVGTAVVSAAYPVLTLWLLNKRSVKAALISGLVSAKETSSSPPERPSS